MEDQTANPDLLLLGDTYHLYFRGQQGGHDRIGVASIGRDAFDGFTWNIYPEPIIDVGEPGSWDESHVLDPATVCVDGRIFLYYSAVSPKCPRSICLATSHDGIHFQKYPGNPVTIGGGPEIVWRDGIFYLYYWKNVPGKSGFQLYLSTSRDGMNFEEYSVDPILPVGPAGAWDSHTVETPRICEDDGVYQMFYCGSDRHDDYPANAGLATSTDLVHWQKSAYNPLFSRGGSDAWDGGAIWFTTVEKIGNTYYLWYEGYGGGADSDKPYDRYLQGGKSQVGLATMQR